MRDIIPVGVETYIASNPLFSGYESVDVLRISQGARKIDLKRKQILFQIGDIPAGFYILLFGQVKLVFLSSQGIEKVVDVIREGESFCEALMFLEQPYIAFAEAMQDCVLLHISKSVIFEEIERNKALAFRMMGGMATRIYEILSDIEEYSLQTGAQRTINYILRELPEAYDSSSALLVKLPFNKRIIASKLNLTQEHFSRILWELSSDGLIDIDGKNIRIQSIARLIDYAA
jgi:CRP-like cAMP-binding protein